jgi:membrane protease YdiL (CAAX protease family)
MKKIGIFYFSAYAYSWSIWLIGMTYFKHIIHPYVLVSVGGLGPVIGLIVYLNISTSMKEKQEYIKRLINIHNVRFSVWIVTILLPFVVVVLSNYIDHLISQDVVIDLNLFKLDENFLAMGFFYPFFLIFFGPIPEELGWRGVAFEELLHHLNYYKAQILVAILWALWHIPLFFIDGSYQNSLGTFTPAFWMFFINIILNSFITGWIYVKSNRSLLMAILFHYSINLSGEMFYMQLQGQVIRMAMFLIIVIILEMVNDERRESINRKSS